MTPPATPPATNLSHTPGTTPPRFWQARLSHRCHHPPRRGKTGNEIRHKCKSLHSFEEDYSPSVSQRTRVRVAGSTRNSTRDVQELLRSRTIVPGYTRSASDHARCSPLTMLAFRRCQLASALFAACMNPDCGHKQSSVRLSSNASGSGDAQTRRQSCDT